MRSDIGLRRFSLDVFFCGAGAVVDLEEFEALSVNALNSDVWEREKVEVLVTGFGDSRFWFPIGVSWAPWSPFSGPRCPFALLPI